MDQTPQMETISMIDPTNLPDNSAKDYAQSDSYHELQKIDVLDHSKVTDGTQNIGTDTAKHMFGDTISTQMRQYDFNIGQVENMHHTGTSSI